MHDVEHQNHDMGKLVQICNIRSGSDLEMATDVAISPSGRYIAVARGRHVDIWLLKQDSYALEYGRELVPGHSGPVNAIAWTPDSQCVATASEDGTAAVVHLDYGLLRRFVGHKAPLVALRFNGERGNLLYTASVDETVMIWDFARGSALRTIAAHAEPVVSLAVAEDDPSVFASGSYDGLVRVFDAVHGHCLRTLTYGKDWRGNHGVPVAEVKLSRNGKYVLAKSMDGAVKIWDLIRGAVVRTFGTGESLHKYGHGVDFMYLEDQVLVASGTPNGTIMVWDTQSKTLQCEIKVLPQSDSSSSSLEETPDEAKIAKNTNEANLVNNGKDVIIAIHSMGTLLAVVTLQGQLMVWEWRSTIK